MAKLRSQADFHKVQCTYGEGTEKTYTFLCTEEIFNTLEEGDFVITNTLGEYKLCKVLAEDSRALRSDITYKHILKKL